MLLNSAVCCSANLAQPQQSRGTSDCCSSRCCSSASSVVAAYLGHPDDAAERRAASLAFPQPSLGKQHGNKQDATGQSSERMLEGYPD